MGRSALSGDSLNVIHAVQGCHGQNIIIKELIFYNAINIPLRKNYTQSLKFIYISYMVRSLTMPFSMSMGAFDLKYFIWFLLITSKYSISKSFFRLKSSFSVHSSYAHFLDWSESLPVDCLLSFLLNRKKGSFSRISSYREYFHIFSL